MTEVRQLKVEHSIAKAFQQWNRPNFLYLQNLPLASQVIVYKKDKR